VAQASRDLDVGENVAASLGQGIEDRSGTGFVLANGGPVSGAARMIKRSNQERRRTIAKPTRPIPSRPNAAGSGTAVSEMPSSVAIGGKPLGVPTDRKVSTSLGPVAVKSNT
jgi:hypothetical protein